MRSLGAAALIALVMLLSGCTPTEGKRCTTIGEVRQDEKTLAKLRCQTNQGDKVPRWTAV